MKVDCHILKGLMGKDFTFPKGSIQKIEKNEALRLMKAGIVEIIEKKKPRTADSKAAKQTTKRKRK